MTLKVVDVSSNNPVSAAITAGADACIVKATQGTYYVNPSCNAEYQLAKSHGLKLGVYHYGGGGDAIAEANFFYNNIKGYIHEAILGLDWEANQNANYTDNNWCRRFVDRIHELTGVWCLIYGNRQDINHCTNLANDCGLWFAGYPDMRNTWTPPAFPYDISPWKNMVGWQYTSGGGLDRSIFYITKEQWDKFANPSSSPSKPSAAPAPKTDAGGKIPIHTDGDRSKGHLDNFGISKKNNLLAKGWHCGNYPHQYIFLMDYQTGKELARIHTFPNKRSDVAKVFGNGYLASGFEANFNVSKLKGKKVYIMMRRTRDAKGNTAGGYSDIHYKDWYLTL